MCFEETMFVTTVTYNTKYNLGMTKVTCSPNHQTHYCSYLSCGFCNIVMVFDP